jgi:CPA1 family monovalent cation:H+ antiporter
MQHGGEIVQIETVLMGLLIAVVAVASVARRFRWPYTVALVLGGLAIAVFQPLGPFTLTLDPEFLLFVFIPPLVFEAAFHLDLGEIRTTQLPILVLAVLGVLLATGITAGILAGGAGVPLTIALLFGALISATDPVAVTAVFRELGVSRRLAHILEGESLFNDGTSIVLFRLLLAVLVSGSFNLLESVSNFLIVALGGAALGAAVGLAVSLLLRRLDDYLVELTITTIVAFGTFILAEGLHLSGVIAVVVAGIVLGNYGERRALSPTTRIRLVQFWEYVAFLANSFVFLLIGLAIDPALLWNNLGLIAWAIGAVLVARAAVIYALGAPIDRVSRTLPMHSRHVLFWGGLRGAVALALALSLPASAGSWQSAVPAMTFGVVLFTLLVQGTTIEWLLQRLGLVEPGPLAYETARARLFANQAVLQWLAQVNQDGIVAKPVVQQLTAEYQTQDARWVEEMRALYEQQEELRQAELRRMRQNAVTIQRSAIQDLLRQGLLSEPAYQALVQELNQQQQTLDDS